MMVEQQPLMLPDVPNHMWSMDLVMDSPGQRAQDQMPDDRG